MQNRREGQLCLVALLTAVCAMPAAAGSIYSVFYDDRFGIIDSNSGAFQQISTLPLAQASGIGVFNDILYVQSMQGELMTVDPASGAATLVGNAGLGTTSEVFAGGPNGLFEIDSLSNLYSINPLTGAAVLVGGLGLPANYGGWDTSLSDDGNNLYFTAGGGGAVDELYEVNTQTGQATDLGSTGISSIAGSAIVGSYLDLFQYNASPHYIYTAPLGFNDFTAGAILSVQIVDGGVTLGPALDNSASNTPEPATFLLLGSGLVGLGRLGRRKCAGKS